MSDDEILRRALEEGESRDGTFSVLVLEVRRLRDSRDKAVAERDAVIARYVECHVGGRWFALTDPSVPSSAWTVCGSQAAAIARIRQAAGLDPAPDAKGGGPDAG